MHSLSRFSSYKFMDNRAGFSLIQFLTPNLMHFEANPKHRSTSFINTVISICTLKFGKDCVECS